MIPGRKVILACNLQFNVACIAPEQAAYGFGDKDGFGS
jgi:hypothetical protein